MKNRVKNFLIAWFSTGNSKEARLGKILLLILFVGFFMAKINIHGNIFFVIIVMVGIIMWLVDWFITKKYIRYASDYGKELIKIVDKKIVERGRNLWYSRGDNIIEVYRGIFEKNTHIINHVISHTFIKPLGDKVKISLNIRLVFSVNPVKDALDFFIQNNEIQEKYFSDVVHYIFVDKEVGEYELLMFFKKQFSTIELREHLTDQIVKYLIPVKDKTEFQSCIIEIEDPKTIFTKEI